MSILITRHVRGQCQTVRQVIKMYLAQARRDLAARSYETVLCILSRFGKACGHLRLAKCRPVDLQCWLNDHPEYRSEWYRRCVTSTIKRAFNWGCEMELIARNPFSKLRSRGRANRRRPMTDEEFQTLLRGSDAAFRRFLVFLKFTGCRPGEAASMRWSDARFEEGSVVLREHKTARKTGRPRIIPLVPTMIKLLMWMRAQAHAKGKGCAERGFADCLAALEAGAALPEGLANTIRERTTYDVGDRAWQRIMAALDANEVPNEADFRLLGRGGS